MKKALSLLALVMTILVLLALMISLQGFEYTGNSNFNPKILAATGFIILAAFTMGELFKQISLPALLGYIAAGVLFGPKLAPLLPNAPEALFSDDVIAELSLINVLTVGLIGTLGGGELKIAELKRHFKTIFLVVGAVALLAVPTTTALIMVLADFVPGMLPFLDGLPMTHRWSAALLLGVFSMAMSPAATLAIIQETRSKGSFTSLSLGIVIVGDIALVVLFLLAFAFSRLLIAPEGFTMVGLMAALPAIGAEIGYAILIGLVTGAVFILYLQFVAREMMLFTVALIFAGSYVSNMLHAETLMAFLTAGFVVQNFSKHGHDMIESLEKISVPVFVIYFMTQAAILDLEAVSGYIGLTAILTGIRALAIFVGINLATRLSDAPDAAQRFGWLGFFSRGGVDLVLASMVAGAMEPWGKDFQTVIMASVVVHIVVGPPLLKLALDWAGETETSRRQTKQEAEDLDEALTTTSLEPTELFPMPGCDDAINGRLTFLRGRLVSLYQDHVATSIAERSERLRKTIDHLAAVQQKSFIRARAIVEDPELPDNEARQKALQGAYLDFLRELKADIDVWETIAPTAVDQDAAQQVVSALQNLESFGSTYRVNRDERLFDANPSDSFWRGFLKIGRRMKRAVVGPGQRTIPLGRLWRFFVELSVPRYLARAATSSASTNEKLWAELNENLRYMAEYHDRLGRALEEVQVFAPSAEKMTSDDHDSQEEEHSPDPPAPDSPLGCALATHARYEPHLKKQMEQLSERFDLWARVSQDMFTLSFQEPWRLFMDAVSVAGSWELPAWKFRPSAVFDRALRAEQQLRDRLRREATVVGGHRGWIVTEYQLVLFESWFGEYQQAVLRSATSMVLEPCQRQIEQLTRRLTAQLESVTQEGQELVPIGWEEWLNDSLRPSVRVAERSFEHVLSSFSKGLVAKRHLSRLDAEVDRLAETVVLTDINGGQMFTIRVPLRTWMESELEREVALRFVEFNERAQALMRNGIEGLSELQQVVEFNVMTAHRDHVAKQQYDLANQLAIGGIKRALRLARELGDEHIAAVDELKRWFQQETTLILERATRAFYEQNLQEIQRRLNRDDSVLASVRGSWLKPWWALNMARVNISERLSPIMDELRMDIRLMLTEEEDEFTNADLRQRLLSFDRINHIHVPTIYRRLFTPGPLDITDFYVPRPEVETECVNAALEWISGTPVSVLVAGDRGMGKRSTIHHLMNGQLKNHLERANVDLVSVVFRDDHVSEADLASELAEVLKCESVTSFQGISRYLKTRERRVVIVIENGEKMFERTEAGIDLCMAVLQLMSDTVDHALWYVLMGTPAATWLETAIGFMDYFTHTLEFSPLTAEELRMMIMRRHRVSGFEATFDRRSLRPLEWARNPIAMSDAVRDPKSEFFGDLMRLSGGNPLLALLYWLECVRLDETDDQTIHVLPLPANEMKLAASVSLEKSLMLAALVQHRSLSAVQLARILRRELPDVRTELDHLSRLGFVEIVVGQDTQSFQLRPLAEALVTLELRQHNMV
jgi:Kef-type K+ transport system membrane component KefB